MFAEGTYLLTRLEQYANADGSNVETVDGIVIVGNDVHDLKTPPPSVGKFVPAANVTDFKLLQYWNEFTPRNVSVFGNDIEVNAVLSKDKSSIVLKTDPAGIENVANTEAYWKHLSFNDLTFLGNTILFNFEHPAKA